MQYAVVDIETTGNNAAVDDMIQIGIVIIEDWKVIDRFDSFLYTKKEITPFIQSLTGITQERIKDAPSFSDIADKVLMLLKDKVFVAHNIHFDLSFLAGLFQQLHIEFKPRYCIDTVDLFKIVFPGEDSYQLGALANLLGHELVDAHSAIADASATAELLILAVHKLERLPKETLIQLYHLSKKLKYNMDQLLFPLIEHHQSHDHSLKTAGIHYIKAEQQETAINMTMSLKEFYQHVIEVNELVYRKEQFYLVELIYADLQNHDIRLIEAEVGSGKSIAYLIAATYFLAQEHESILLTTATKALQDQLMYADAYMIERALGTKLPLVLLKSKRNYISVEFVKFLLDDDKENHDILMLKMQLLVFMLEGKEGDIERLNLNGGRKIYFDLMRNLYKPKQDTYLFHQINEYSKVLGITNHSHLLHSGSEGFPKHFMHLIIDEGHQLQEVALSHTYDTFSYQSVKYHLSQLSKDEGLLFTQLKHINHQKRSLADSSVSLFQLKEHVTQIDQLNDQLFSSLEAVEYEESFYYFPDKARELLTELILLLKYLREDLQHVSAPAVVIREVSYISRIYETVASALNHERLVFYEQANGSRSTIIIYVKKYQLSEVFERQLARHFRSMTLLSGSLLLDRSIEHLLPLIGSYNKEVVSFNPMHRSEKVTFFIPDDVPLFNYRNASEYIEYVVLYITAYLSTGHQKLLVLFNNYQMIKEVASYMEAVDDHVLLVQTPQSNTHKMLTQFNQLDRAVLLGTQGFYEGLDYQSKDFKCVMIVSLPFIHPSDKRLLLMQNEMSDSFSGYQLPYAATKVRQAAGRLIRHENDDGLIICLDRRIKEASYHEIFDTVLKQYHVRRGSLSEMVSWIEKNKPPRQI